jgi:hypothetical protein
MTTVLSTEPRLELADLIVRLVKNAESPLAFKDVKAACRQLLDSKLKDTDLRETLQEIVLGGRIFECSPVRNQPRYWKHDEEQLARELIAELASEKPVAATRLTTALKKELASKPSECWCKRIIEAMKAEQVIFVHPPTGKSKGEFLFVRPLELRDYLKLTKPVLTSLQKMFARLEASGFSREDIGSALLEEIRPIDVNRESARAQVRSKPSAPNAELESLILKGMRELEPNAENGEPVLLWELRRLMPPEYRTHEAFDRTVLHLAEKGIVTIQRHDEPDLLSDEDRMDMVLDRNGQPFFYISLRKS